jgi:hypothetical protein
MKEYGSLKKINKMLTRRDRKELPAREQNIVDDCEEPKSFKEVTHLLVYNTMHVISPGLYIYNPITEILTSLDDEIIGLLPKSDIIKEATASSYTPYKHIPTWDKMIEDGEVKDNRTKKEDDVVPEAADTVKKVEAKAPVKRSLGF